MEATEAITLKTFEVSIPEEYVATIRKVIQGLGGKMKARKEKKCGLDEALEDIKAGRIQTYKDFDDFKQQMRAL